MKEAVLSFACEGAPLLGILAEPSGEPASVGVLIIVGGPQYRAGSHRQFTLLARSLAAQGFSALRFDYRGMGDSGGGARDFQDINDDIRAAIDALLATNPFLRRIVLWGLCDAASAALLYLESTRDARVSGIALVNPWVRSAATLAQTHVKHYYWQRFRDRGFWAKLLRGGVGLGALRTFAGNLRLARTGRHAASGGSRSFQDRMAAGLEGFEGATLLILSGNDYTAKEFVSWVDASKDRQALLNRRTVERHDLASADHTLSASADHQALCGICLAWLKTQCPPALPSPAQPSAACAGTTT